MSKVTKETLQKALARMREHMPRVFDLSYADLYNLDFSEIRVGDIVDGGIVTEAGEDYFFIVKGDQIHKYLKNGRYLLKERNYTNHDNTPICIYTAPSSTPSSGVEPGEM